MSDYVIITHTDLDGIASAALIIKHLRGTKVEEVDIRFAQPNRLHRALKGLSCSRLYICDLSINKTTYLPVVEELRRLVGSGTKIYWFDHHIWDDSWIEELRGLGIKLYVNSSTCTAGLIALYLDLKDPGSHALVRATCSNDLWMFNDPLGSFLSRYVACKKGNKWRKHLINKLIDFDGEIDEEILRCAEAVVDRDLTIMDKALKNSIVVNVNGVRIVFTMKYTDESSISYLAHYLMSKTEADIAIVCKENGLSIRSKDLNIRDLAVRLGGGGHPKAAGAPFKLPILYKLLLFLGLKKFVLRYCSRVVIKELKEVLLSRA